ncbi:hypothetical protein VTJ04DRAFT_2797 [Mycothermus thermophilus]|uniref:uncharacterized protein n=1 Tax=Humicola insolens TaxID=85995 RepID=UPI0037440784
MSYTNHPHKSAEEHASPTFKSMIDASSRLPASHTGTAPDIPALSSAVLRVTRHFSPTCSTSATSPANLVVGGERERENE